MNIKLSPGEILLPRNGYNMWQDIINKLDLDLNNYYPNNRLKKRFFNKYIFKKENFTYKQFFYAVDQYYSKNPGPGKQIMWKSFQQMKYNKDFEELLNGYLRENEF